MRDGGLVGLAGCKVLFGCFSAKGSVGSVGVVAMLEGVDEGVEVLDAGWQVVDGVELVAPRAVAALHRAVELGAPWRQEEELDGVLLAGVLELGHELRAAVNLNGVDLEGHVGKELVEEYGGRGCGGTGVGL